MESKTAFITGANRGIGFEIARQLGKKGFHVYISARDRRKLNDALSSLRHDLIEADMIVMDVTSNDSILRAAEAFDNNRVSFDVIINNAGIMLREDRSLLESENDLLEAVIDTNSYGPLRVTKAFLHLLKRPGKIINISSTGGSMSEPVGDWSPAYCTSKTLLNAITRHLARELRSDGISVNAVCPGWTRTDMGGENAPRSIEKGAETPVWLATEVPNEISGKFFRDRKEIKW
jgi:NAD(P)-dependent dehydrogenase (short-subunit alcohol dehydrogenase family)